MPSTKVFWMAQMGKAPRENHGNIWGGKIIYIYNIIVIGSTLVASVPTSAMRSPPFSMASWSRGCCKTAREASKVLKWSPHQNQKCRPRHSVATVHSLWLSRLLNPTSTHLLACLSQKQLRNTRLVDLLELPRTWMASRGLCKAWTMTGVIDTFTLPTENLVFTFCDVILIFRGLKPFYSGFCGCSFFKNLGFIVQTVFSMEKCLTQEVAFHDFCQCLC